MPATHILVVDDDGLVRRMLERYLTGEGYRVSSAENGDTMRKVLADNGSPVQLVLLDVTLPGEDGLDLAREIRQMSSNIGIIMVTGRGATIDRVIGLEVGADDYVPKPFHLREVLARIRSVLRRLQPAKTAAPAANNATDPDAVQFDGWSLDLSRRQLTRMSGEDVPLTTGEFDLLAAFIRHPGRVLDRDRLMDLTKGRTWEAFDRTIDAQVSRLRRKIEVDPRNPTLIKSVRGVGYVFTGSPTRGR